MKTNIWQIITSGLCAVLLVIIMVQGKKLDELSKRLDSKADSLRYELQNEVQNITHIVTSKLEELDKIVLSSELKPIGVNRNDKQLLAKATIILKEWYEDTEVTLYTTIGDKKLPVAMTTNENGVFSAIVALPCEVGEQNTIELDAMVSGGTLTKKESLGAWGDISLLLPLRFVGAGWTGPTYKNGVMSSSFSISIAGQSGALAVINHPEFWVYKNGEIAQKLKAIQSTNHSSDGIDFSVNTEDNLWSIDCEAGDNIEIRFRCEDEYGLGYDFWFTSWVALEETNENSLSEGGKSLVLYWPE